MARVELEVDFSKCRQGQSEVSLWGPRMLFNVWLDSGLLVSRMCRQ